MNYGTILSVLEINNEEKNLFSIFTSSLNFQNIMCGSKIKYETPWFDFLVKLK